MKPTMKTKLRKAAGGSALILLTIAITIIGSGQAGPFRRAIVEVSSYIDANVYKQDGVEYDLSTMGGSGGHTIQDDGTPVTDRAGLNFTGTGVAVSDDSMNDATVITITAGTGDVDSVNGQTGAVVLDPDDLDDTLTTNKFTTAGDTAKLAGIETGATADQSDSEIETAYNNQVPAASQAEMEAGTETAIRRMSPLRVAQAVAEGVSGVSEQDPTYGSDAGASDDAVYVDASDNVGIGTTTPTGGVHLYRTTAAPRLVTQYFSAGGAGGNPTEIAGAGANDAVDGPAWASPANITGDDTSYAGAISPFTDNVETDWLVATLFGFNIPLDAEIVGIQANFDGRYNGSTEGHDVHVHLVIGGVRQTGVDKANGVPWGSSFSLQSYGGAADPWGGLTPSQANATDFGVAITMMLDTGDSVDIDYVSIQITYTQDAAVDATWSSGVNATGQWSVNDGSNDHLRLSEDLLQWGSTAPGSAWATGRNAFELGPLFGATSQATGANWFFNAYDSSAGTPEYSYVSEGAASRLFWNSNGDLEFYEAETGTGVITWTKRLTLGDTMTFHAVAGTDFTIASDGAVTGDITATPGDGTVTNAKLANMAQATIKGRASGAGTGTPGDLTAAQVRTIINVEDGAQVNTVTSVNSQTGAVVLDPDDLDDAATTNKFVTAADITKLGNLSGTNTGDQDLSSYAQGAASSTDNALARFDSTTGKLLQNGTITEDDSGNLAGVGTLNTHTIPGGTSTFVTTGATQTLAGKRLEPLVASDTTSPVAIDSDAVDIMTIVLTENTIVSVPTGSPLVGDTLLVRAKQDVTPWTLTFTNAANGYLAGESWSDTIPAIRTEAGAWDFWLFMWNDDTVKWELLSYVMATPT